jgi:phosphoribosyl 1,2-cyclic phosphate phosphodiesterase
LQPQILKITFLGTGTSSGVPMIACNCSVCTSLNTQDKRLRSSIKIETNTTTIVIDTTPDFRYQMLRTHTTKLDAVVFTHPHKDHLAGLDDVRAYNFFTQQPMPLFANELTADAIKKELHYAFAEKKYPGVPNLILNNIDTNNFIIGDIELTPIKVWHLKMPVLGFRVNDFTYITDANKIDEEEKQKIIGSKILVLNALRKEEHISHFTLQQATNLANELNIPEVYFTHISHQMGKHTDVNNELPSHIQLAYDGLVLEV